MSASERPHGSGLQNVGWKVASPAVGNVTRGTVLKKRRTQPEEPICDGPPTTGRKQWLVQNTGRIVYPAERCKRILRKNCRTS
jgi:hypothetical protein